ncbi:MAG: hypothetical protein K9M99_09565 [Candidatus Cloacimonetes bacterium]|nr:hypothetical protein [Candidatus Cloacimonadota bacterium]
MAAAPQETNVLTYLVRHFEIHGELEGVVYRTKRNGEQEKYPYEPQSYYQRTPLTIRNEWIRKFACTVTNPNNNDYTAIVKKLYYYTPYIVPAGDWKFRGETVLYIRERGEYKLVWNSSPVGEKRVLGKRTEVEFSFEQTGEYTLDCYFAGEVYCQRSFVVSDSDLDESYETWLAAHLEEILTLAEPEYESLKTYRRGLRSKRNWLCSLEGKCGEEVLYELPNLKHKDRSRQAPWLYHRRDYDHQVNEQTRIFNEKMAEVGDSWQSLSEEQKADWEAQAEAIWRKKGRTMKHPRLSGFNLYTREYLTEFL